MGFICFHPKKPEIPINSSQKPEKPMEILENEVQTHKKSIFSLKNHIENTEIRDFQNFKYHRFRCSFGFY